MDDEVRAVVVDPDTGEIIDAIHEGDSYTVQTKEQKEFLAVYGGEEFNKGATFVKLYDDVIPKLKEKLTPSEFVFIISLSSHVSYNDCIIRATNDAKSSILTPEDLASVLNMDYGVVRRLLSSLKKKGVIGTHETGTIIKGYEGQIRRVITVNPYIYFRGCHINDTVKQFYDNSGWA